jgi:hypothetical protein
MVMALPATKFDEGFMDERTAKLESHVEHIQKDIGEIKLDIRRIDAKVDALRESLHARIDALKD